MKLLEMLSLDILEHSRVVAGAAGLQRDIHWVHIVDLPDMLPWVGAEQFLLTTGYAWPHDEGEQRALIRALAERNLAGIGLAVPQFFDHFPEAACDEANLVALPLLEIPWDVPFAHITEAAHRAILAEQSRIIEQSEAIHRALTRAAVESESLQELAATLGRLIERAITIVDTRGGILADYVGEQAGDEVRRAKRQMTPEFMHRLKHLGYLHTIHTTGKSVRIPTLPELDLSARVVCPIRLREELVGLVCIVEGGHGLSELDMRAAEHAAIIAALHIAHQRELAAFEAQLGYTFLDTLLEGSFEATPQALERARLLGFDAEASYRVGLLVLDELLPLSREGLLRREHLAGRLRERLKFLEVPPLLSVSLNRICFLLPEQYPGEHIWKGLTEESVSLAFGQPYRGIEGVRHSYREVLSLQVYLLPNSFHYYETLLLPRVLLGDQEAQQAFLEQLLGNLKRQRNGEILLETLLTWAHIGFHFSSVARQLNIHPKTLQYRLARAGELAGLDLADPEIRFRLQLASHLLSLQEKKLL